LERASQRRVGKFQISDDIIDEQPQVARAVLSGLIVLRAEALHHAYAIEYIAAGDQFEPITLGEMVPMYTVSIRDLIGGKYDVTFSKST
jgi:hypothetical protein